MRPPPAAWGWVIHTPDTLGCSVQVPLAPAGRAAEARGLQATPGVGSIVQTDAIPWLSSWLRLAAAFSDTRRSSCAAGVRQLDHAR
jgi:hypothetical protein